MARKSKSSGVSKRGKMHRQGIYERYIKRPQDFLCAYDIGYFGISVAEDMFDIVSLLNTIGGRM